MSLVRWDREPAAKDLRWFAGLWFPAFALMVGMVVYRRVHSPVAAIAIWVLAALLSLTALWSTRVIRWVYVAIMGVTFPIGLVISNIVVVLAYFAVITPIGLLLRLFHDPLQRAFPSRERSHWIPREQPTKAAYLRQI